MQFEDPGFLLLLLLLPAYLPFGRKKHPRIGYPSVKRLKKTGTPLKVRLIHLPEAIKYAALVLIVIALARPQLANSEREVSTRGTDIILALDLSGSMMAEDFKPNNRLYVAKAVIRDFIENRRNDRIGLVSFAGKAYTQSPLTLDYGMILALIDGLEIGRMEDGTAIGMAVAEGVKRLKDSEAKTKIIILLTDGDNNAGNIDPLTAAKAAKAFGIKVYTIGVGSEGGAPVPVYDPLFGKIYARDSSGNILLTKINEEVLKSVAETTGAVYYRATDSASLSKIYQAIDSLEKSDIKLKEFYSYADIYHYFLIAVLVFMAISATLKSTWLWRYP